MSISVTSLNEAPPLFPEPSSSEWHPYQNFLCWWRVWGSLRNRHFLLSASFVFIWSMRKLFTVVYSNFFFGLIGCQTLVKAFGIYRSQLAEYIANKLALLPQTDRISVGNWLSKLWVGWDGGEFYDSGDDGIDWWHQLNSDFEKGFLGTSDALWAIW